MSSKLGLSLAGIFDSQFDPDAIAFLSAAGLTDSATSYAINDLVTGMKINGLWTKMQAIYPFAGSTATTQKWNLKDPRDLDAAYRLTFSGGWTHASTGATPNGTNAFANTFLPANTMAQNSVHISYYSRTNSSQAGAAEIGAERTGGIQLAMQVRGGANQINAVMNDGTGTYAANSNASGFFIGNRTASNVVNSWKNGVKATTSAVVSQTPPTQNIYLGASNGAGSAYLFSNREAAFASAGAGLTDTDALVLSSLVQRYQTALSRAIVAVPTVQDLDAQNFLVAAGITDSTQAQAIQNLTAGLKFNSLWDKMQAIYPFVGSTATTQKFNLKSPFDTDASFRLVFNGGWTHSSTGALPNGTNAFADTKYIASTSSNLTSAHFSIYSRTAGSAAFQMELGVANGDAQRMLIVTRWSTDITFADLFSVNQRSVISPAPTSTGLFTVSRNASNEMIVYRNGSSIGTNTSTDGTASLPTLAPYLSAYNNAGSAANFSNKQLAFATIGSKLGTSTENSNFYTVVQAYQTALSRQV